MKRSIVITIMLLALSLWLSDKASSQCPRTSYLGFQKIAAYHSESDNKFYLVLLATDEDTRPERLDLRNLHVLIKSPDGTMDMAIPYKELIIINLGNMMAEIDKKYTFFKFNLTIDTSSSIPPDSLLEVKKFCVDFIKNLPVSFEGQIIKFSNQIQKSQFTKDKQELIRIIDAIEPDYMRRGTALHDAIATAVEEIKLYSQNVPFKFSVILTDGKEEHSTRYDDPGIFADFVISETTQFSIPLFIVGITDHVDDQFLTKIANYGMYKAVNDFSDVEKAMKIFNNFVRDIYIFKIPYIEWMKKVDKIYIVKESQIHRGKYETIQDVCIR